MSITSPDDRITHYEPVVATTTFAADFPVFDNDDIKVFVDGVERTDFAVSATYVQGISNDARAVFSPGITGLVDVIGARDPRRTNRFINGAPLQIWQQNLALDTVEAELQEAKRDIDRSHRAPYGEEGGVFTAADIGQAQDYAAQAAQSNQEAGEAADRVEAAEALILALIDASTPVFATKAIAEAYTPVTGPTFLRTAGYSAPGDNGGAFYKKVASEPTHAGKLVISLSGGGTAWYELSLGQPIFAEMFGAKGDNATDCTSAILAAHVFLRGTSVALSNDGLTGKAITAYTSGQLNFGRGIFRVLSGQILITQELNLRWKGQGHRGATNYIRAATTILITGSAAWGIKVYGNGARGFATYDMDVCYETSAFTGDIVQNVGAPYFEPECCFFGTFGITGGTRLITARSCISVGMEEFFNPQSCIFDGAQTLIKIEDENALATFTGSVSGTVLTVTAVSAGELGVGLRLKDAGVPFATITSLGTGTGGVGTYNLSASASKSSRPLTGDIPFGGSNSHIQDCIFYDAANKHIEYRGARSRHAQKVERCIVNPLNLDCAVGIDLRNIEALSLDNVDFTSSSGAKATNAWLYLENCYGLVEGCNLGALSPAGFLKGVLSVLGCTLKGTNGFNIIDGVIFEKGNRVDLSTGPAAYGFYSDGAPTLHFEGGMSSFGSGVRRSYSFPTNANAAGRIYRRAVFDASVEGPVVSAAGISVVAA